MLHEDHHRPVYRRSTFLFGLLYDRATWISNSKLYLLTMYSSRGIPKLSSPGSQRLGRYSGTYSKSMTARVTKFIPKTRDFVPLAKAIADSQDKGAGCDISQFIAPIDVIRSALRDAIKPRTMFLTIWARISKSKDNDGHATFIWDLEQIRDVLETVQAPPAADQNTEDVTSKVGSLRLSRSNATSSNRYEGLTVSQTSDSGLEKTASPVSVLQNVKTMSRSPQRRFNTKPNTTNLISTHFSCSPLFTLLPRSFATMSPVFEPRISRRLRWHQNTAIQLAKDIEVEVAADLYPSGDLSCLSLLEKFYSMHCDEEKVPSCRSPAPPLPMRQSKRD